MNVNKQKTIREPAREIPVIQECDVLVCGGGPAGIGAALAAARNGAKTILIENQICLGGMATAGMVNRLGPYHDQKQIILGGIPWEILRKLVDRGLAQEPKICAPGNWMDYWLVFDPEGMKRLLDQLMLDASVTVYFASQVVAPIMVQKTITGVIFESKSGRQAITAKTVIDATGDADIAARAGAPFDIGRDSDQRLQPFTLFFKCLNMDWPKALAYVRDHHKELRKLATEEVGNDFILAGTDSFLHAEETYFNCLHEHDVNGTDVRDISQAAMALRRKMWGNVEILNRHVPGCENTSLICSAAAMGVRETRRIRGAYELTIDDVLDARQFPDQIMRYACFVDIHEPVPGKQSSYSNRSLEPGTSYGIPYRCLIPQAVDNLLVAGRCLSATHEALASARMMPACMAMGQAAGTAAAISLQQECSVRDLAPTTLRQSLETQGVIL